VVADVGCAIIGQTDDLAPADRRLYGIRDVTATVESIPLITASILSKKLAAGLGALVLDVKTGSGAFMETPDEARALAQSLVSVANGAGMATSALITDMHQPLASAAGNAVEVKNAVDFLTGRHRDPRLWEVTVALGGEVLALGSVVPDAASGAEKMEQALETGRAAEIFGRMCAALGGPADFMEKADDHLPAATLVRDVHADDEGVVTAIDTRDVGVAVIELGGGRRRAEDTIDHAVGLSGLARIGDAVGPSGRPLATVHARRESDADRAAIMLRAAYRVGATADAQPRPVLERVGG